MKRKIVWACLVGMLSGSVFGAGGTGSLYVKRANHVSSCDVYYYISSSFQQSLKNYSGDGSEPLYTAAQFDKGIIVSNIVVDSGYLPVVTAIDEYDYEADVTNRISGSSNGSYSHVPANLSNLRTITFDLQTTLVTNKITYDTNGGTLPPDSPVAYTVESATITLPQPEPAYTYYAFGGWYDNSDFTGTAITTIPTGSLGNRTFHAKWTNKVYTVTLNLNEGWILVNGEQVYDSPFVTNYTYSVGLDLPEFGKTGYLAGGWHRVQDCSDSTVTSIGTAEFGDREFWAKFTERKYTVTLDQQGGTGGSVKVTVSYNGDMNSITPPSRMGYDFEGYYDEQGESGTIYYDASGNATRAWPFASGGTLYAHWTPHPYVVSFVGGAGATGEMAQLALTYDVAATLPTNAFSKTGYQFVGWKTNETDGVTFADGQTVSNLTAEANGEVTMTATWSAGRYSIQFDANASDAAGEMAIQDIEYDEGTALAANAFTRVGYSLAGWAWDKNAKTNEVDFADCQVVTNLTDEIDSTNTLYAVWKAEEYEVSLDANAAKGGYFRVATNVVVTVTNEVEEVVTNIVKVVTDQAKVTYNTAYDLPVPVNEEARMTFNGWKYIDPETGDVKPLEEQVPLHAKGITNLVAQWKDGLAVALNANGTDLEYVTGGYKGLRDTAYDAPWIPRSPEGDEHAGQSGDLPGSDSGSYGSYLQTVLPGAGVLTYRWRIIAPVAYYREEIDAFYGNRIRFVDVDAGTATNLVPYLATGDDYDDTEWRDSGWQTVVFTNSTENPLTVEWRFESLPGQNQLVGGTGWVDRVTWTPAGGLRPVATVTSYDRTYDGAGHGIEVNVTQPASGATVKYALDAEGPYAEEEILFTNVTETAVTVWYTVEADGYASVTNSGTVKISPKTLTGTMVSLAETSYTHDGTAKEPAVAVVDGNPSILTTNDYEVAYSNNVEVGEATVIVTGKGNYAGEVLKHFTISSADDPPPSPAEIGHAVSSYEEPYDGAGHGIEVSVTKPESGWAVKYALDEAGPYAEGEIFFTNVTDQTVWYTVEADGYATATNSGTVKISPKTLTDMMVSVEETPCIYDGSEKKPAVTVVDGNPSILTANDYDVAYSNNMEVGEATVVVVGKGNYAGEVLKHFTISPAGEPPATIVHTVTSYEGVYDGAGHGITVSVTTPETGAVVKYALDEAGPYAEEEILFTNVTETAVTVWCTVEADGYATVTNSGTVKISSASEDLVVPGYGTVTIPKTWKVGQKVTWKAVAAKGSVFAHWEGDFVDSLQLSANELRNPSLAFAVPESFNTNDIQAVFIAIDSDGLRDLTLTQTEFELKEPVSDVWVKDDSKSYVTASASGLPTGLKFNAKTLEITGAPTKSGIYWVQVKAKNASGYQWAENFKVTVPGGGTEAKEPKLTRTKYYPLTVLSADAVAGTVTGTGVYADGKKASIRATAAKEHVFAGWYRDRTLTDPMTFAAGDFRTASQSVIVPEVRYLFARFETVEADKASLKVNVDDVVTEKDGTIGTIGTDGTRALDLGACVESLSLPKLTVTGLPTGLKYDAKTLKITGKATKPGVYTVKVAATNTSVKKATDETTATFTITMPNFESAMLPRLLPTTDAYGIVRAGVTFDPDRVDCTPENGWTVKVAGLPTGLKYDAKTGKITGVPTAKAGSYTVTFTASKKGEANQVATITLNIEALPAWAVGAFDGAVLTNATSVPLPAGLVTLTVAANGKISGKLLEGDKTWTLSAPAYEEERDSDFIATVVGKSGKEVMTNEVTIAVGELRHYPDDGLDLRGVATGGPQSAAAPEWTAWQNLWKTEPWKTYAKPFANKKLPLYVVNEEAGLVVRDALQEGDDVYGTIELKFAATGAVTASGKFVTGQDAKGKDIIYSASSSSVLIPDSEVYYNDNHAVYLHFPPKAGKFDGYSVEVPLVWKDPMFQLDE